MCVTANAAAVDERRPLRRHSSRAGRARFGTASRSGLPVAALVHQSVNGPPVRLDDSGHLGHDTVEVLGEGRDERRWGLAELEAEG